MIKSTNSISNSAVLLSTDYSDLLFLYPGPNPFSIVLSIS